MEVLSLQMGYPFIDPRFTKVDMPLLKRIPPRCREKGSYLPIKLQEDKRVMVAFADPLDREDQEEAGAALFRGTGSGHSAQGCHQGGVPPVREGLPGRGAAG